MEVFLKDDLTAFEEKYYPILLDNNIFYDHFSMLSILYLFNCKKILNKYKKFLIENYNKPKLNYKTNNIINKKFNNLAKRKLRYYVDTNDVNPLEILALKKNYKEIINFNKLNKNKKDNSNFIYLNNNQINILNSILKLDKKDTEFNVCNNGIFYSSYGYEINKHKGIKIIIPILVFICIISILPFACFYANIYYGSKPIGKGTFTDPYLVYNAKQLSYSSSTKNRHFKLMKNINFSDNKTIPILDDYIDCDMHSILTNTTIFDVVNQGGVICNLTLKINLGDGFINFDQEKQGLLCNTNNGDINRVTILNQRKNYTKSHTFNHDSTLQNRISGILCATNNNLIKHCIVDVDESIYLDSQTTNNDCMFGTIAGENYGSIINCVNYSDINSYYQDFGSICGINRKIGKIVSCVNNGNLKSKINKTDWTTRVGGISCFNEGTIFRCKNNGDLSSSNLYSEAKVGGIVSYLGSGKIEECLNSGKVFADSKYSSCGGIVADSKFNSKILYCLNKNNVVSVSKEGGYSGGIVAICEGLAMYSICTNVKIEAKFDNEKYWRYRAGGIAGHAGINDNNMVAFIEYCISFANLIQPNYGEVCGYYKGEKYNPNNVWLDNENEYADAGNQNDNLGIAYKNVDDIKELDLYKQIMEKFNG